MPRDKFNLVGTTFNYNDGAPKCSVWSKKSKHIEWVDDGGRGTFYIDTTINQAFNDNRKGLKYLWLLESKYITPKLVESIISNRELVEDTYETIFTHDQRLLSLGDM